MKHAAVVVSQNGLYYYYYYHLSFGSLYNIISQLNMIFLQFINLYKSSQLHALAVDCERVDQFPDLLLHGEQVQDGADVDGARPDQGEGAVQQPGHDGRCCRGQKRTFQGESFE